MDYKYKWITNDSKLEFKSATAFQRLKTDQNMYEMYNLYTLLKNRSFSCFKSKKPMLICFVVWELLSDQ